MNPALLVGLFGIVVACIALVWYAIANVKQATLLRRLAKAGPGREGDLLTRAGETMALHGRIKILAPLAVPGLGNCLWHRQETQERRGMGKHKHWHTVDTREAFSTFALVVGNVEIDMGGPTEVHGKFSRQSYEGLGLLGFVTRGSTRTIDRWLPVPPSLTVVGRLRARGTTLLMEPDPSVGLLWSPRSPWATAWRESLKGWSALALATALVALGAWLAIYS